MKIKHFLLVIFIFSYNISKTQIIILSKASQSYRLWLQKDGVIILDAYNIKNTDSILAIADGIILTGGEDINPLQYNNTVNLAFCGNINYERDTLERKLFDFAMKNQIPLIGVCRGMQMMNVACGGTLYGDIPTEIGSAVIHRSKKCASHKIIITDTCSFIFPLNCDTLLVNSYHHQGLKNIPNNLRVIAKSLDGLPEAVTVKTLYHPFMIAVQFHPEKLEKNNVVYTTIKNSFYNAIYYK
jgi:putative glutamine amidotransferase